MNESSTINTFMKNLLISTSCHELSSKYELCKMILKCRLCNIILLIYFITLLKTPSFKRKGCLCRSQFPGRGFLGLNWPAHTYDMHFLKADGMWNTIVSLKRWVVETFILTKKSRLFTTQKYLEKILFKPMPRNMRNMKI